MQMDNELGIIKNCQAGKKDDFGLIYDWYIKKIYSFIYYKVQNKEVAEDLTSETFLKVLDKIKSFNPKKGKFSSWLYQIARNTVIDFFRTKKSHSPIEELWGLKDDTDIARDAEARASLNKVKGYLQKMKADQREIIILRIWDNLSYKEIAQIVGRSESGCKMAFFRAISTLREEMPQLLVLIYIVLNSVGDKN